MIPNIVLFATGRTWDGTGDAFVSNDGWVITRKDILEHEDREVAHRLVSMMNEHIQERNERAAARMTPKPDIEHARVEAWDGHWYVIRDVWDHSAVPLSCAVPLSFSPYAYCQGSRLLRCEYAVRQPDGSILWTECPEGVRYEDIQPWA